MASRKIKVGGKYIQAYFLVLQDKSLIILKGKKGYVMCGYLNLSAANKFKDVAAKITGVSSIEEALRAKVCSVSAAAKRIGIFKGQPVREVLEIIS